MDRYGVGDVERLLRIPRSTIRSLVNAGFVSPGRGPGNRWRFSFQDLAVLRTARALAEARVPQRRIPRAMREMKRHAESGQRSLQFGEVVDVQRALVPAEPGTAPQPGALADLINRGYDLHQAGKHLEALRAYLEARRSFGDDAMLFFNLGVLLEDMRRKPEAMTAYEASLACDDSFADAHYNLALLCETAGRRRDAIRHMARYRDLIRA